MLVEISYDKRYFKTSKENRDKISIIIDVPEDSKMAFVQVKSYPKIKDISDIGDSVDRFNPSKDLYKTLLNLFLSEKGNIKTDKLKINDDGSVKD